MSTRKTWMLLLLLVTGLLTAACEPRDLRTGAKPLRSLPGADAAKGRQLLSSWGCGSCHHIPGVTGAEAYVGPPLDGWSQRTFIAGKLENTPENLVRWIMDPQAIEPGTAMPDADAPEDVARHMAAYLYTLQP